MQYLKLPWPILFLRHPQPILFFGRPRPISFFPTFYVHMGFYKILWAFLTQLPHYFPLGLLAFEPISFTNSFIWAPLARFCFLSISHDSHGFNTSFFEGFFGMFAFFGATLLFCGLMDHYSYHSSSMIFTMLFSFFTFFLLLGFFYHWAILPKMGIKNLFRIRLFC